MSLVGLGRPRAARNTVGGTILNGPRSFRLFSVLLGAMLVLLAGISCGGGLNFGGLESNRPAAWPGHNFEGALSSGSFSLVAMNDDESAIDTRATSALRLDVRNHGTGRYRVDIYGQGLPSTDRVFLHLKYDEKSTHPVASVLEPALREDTLFLGLSDYPGIVALGMVGMRGAKTLSGDALLASVEFDAGAPAVSRRASTVTGGLVKDLHFDSTNTDTLVWSLANSGDYNQNGQVSITDLTQIGIYFQARNTDANWNEARVADGDENGIIAVQDLTPIGLNFLRRCDGYSVQAGSAESGPFSPIGSASVNDAVAPGGVGFKVFNYQVGAPVNGAWYVVAAVDESASQTATGLSNAVEYASANFPAPQNLSASNDGSKITLSWEAPSGFIPDGYACFVSDSAAMAGAQQMNVGAVTQLSFDCPLAVAIDATHFFGVKAIYGAELSGFSNVFNYSPVGAPPSGLSAAKNGAVVSLNWSAPASGTPEGYNAYVDDSNSDMSAALKINLGAITNLNFDCPLAVSPDSSHYFAVKAIFNGEESGYSNIFFYEPGNPNDSDPPAWDVPGQEGIKSAVGGDTVVDIEWYTASDTGSPPVSYQIFYAPSASGINWAGAPQDTSAAGTTTKQISGLSNGTSYDFGVRAVDNSGNATTNTNFLSATPAGGGVPVDDGVWQTPELVDDGGLVNIDIGLFSSIQVAGDGTIGIAHHDPTNQDLYYTFGGPGGWTTELVKQDGDVGLWCDLAFDPSNDEPCIAYHNAGNASLEFARRTNGAWDIQVVDDGSGDFGSFASLAFDPDDNSPAIAYFSYLANDTKFAKWNGSSWSKTTIFNGQTHPLLPLSGAFCSLAFNPVTGEPGVAVMKVVDEFFTPSSSSLYLEFNGSSWDQYDADLGANSDIINTAGYNNALAFSPSGVPYVLDVDSVGTGEAGAVTISYKQGQAFTSTAVYEDFDLGGLASDFTQTDIYFKGNDFYWVSTDGVAEGSCLFGKGFGAPEVIGGAGTSGDSVALGIDSSGDFNVSYRKSSTKQLFYSKKIGDAGAWTSSVAMTGTNVPGTVGEKASMAFDPSDGYPLISYYDVSHSALKFADRKPGTWRDEIASNEGFDGGFSSMTVTPGGDRYISFFAVRGSGVNLSGGLYLLDGDFGNWNSTIIQEGGVGGGGGEVVGDYCSVCNSGAPNALPGIAYRNSSDQTLEFALGDGGGSFEQTVADMASGDAGRWTSCAFRPNTELPAIAYYTGGTGDLAFAERDGLGVWNAAPVDITGDVGNRCSLVFGQNTAQPWMSYYDATNHKLKVVYRDNQSIWQQVNIPAPESSADYGGWSSIAWHPVYNRAAVAFYDDDNGKLWYVFIGDPNAPQAAVEAHAPVSGKVGAHCSLQFNAADGQPSIAYQDVTNGDLYYVERHAN